MSIDPRNCSDHFVFKCAHGQTVSQCPCEADDKPEAIVACPAVCAQLAADLPFINDQKRRTRGRDGRYEPYEGM